jgi:hypothetical protein
MLRFLKESAQVEMFIIFVGLRIEGKFGRVYKPHSLYFHVLVNANDSNFR